MKKIAVVISPNYRDYAQKYLHDCMASLRTQDYLGEIKYFITDNETSPESFRLLRELAPEAELVLNSGNDGFAKGCNDSIKLALSQNFEYIFLVNMDTVMDPSCLLNLVKVADVEQNACFVQPRIMLWQDKTLINSLGNSTHFLGFGYCYGYNKKWDDLKDGVRKKIMYFSGAGVLIRASNLKKIGLFDEKLHMYNEDQDLGWKAWLAGFENIIAPDALMYHKYEFAKSIQQYYYMDRNRIIEILKCYKIATFILIFPAFFVMELGLIFFSIKSGWLKEKVRVWLFFLSPQTWHYIFRERNFINSIRVKKDSEILLMFSGEIWYQEIDDWKLKFINPIFNLYFGIVKKIIFW